MRRSSLAVFCLLHSLPCTPTCSIFPPIHSTPFMLNLCYAAMKDTRTSRGLWFFRVIALLANAHRTLFCVVSLVCQKTFCFLLPSVDVSAANLRTVPRKPTFVSVYTNRLTHPFLLPCCCRFGFRSSLSSCCCTRTSSAIVCSCLSAIAAPQVHHYRHHQCHSTGKNEDVRSSRDDLAFFRLREKELIFFVPFLLFCCLCPFVNRFR